MTVHGKIPNNLHKDPHSIEEVEAQILIEEEDLMAEVEVVVLEDALTKVSFIIILMKIINELEKL
jgi:hypothetical protein